MKSPLFNEKNIFQKKIVCLFCERNFFRCKIFLMLKKQNTILYNHP